MMQPTAEQRREMVEINHGAHAWIDTLQVSGVNENAAVAGIVTALCERSIRAMGVDATANWLRRQADLVADSGDALLAEIKRQGR